MDKRITYIDAREEITGAGEQLSQIGEDLDSLYLSCLRIADLIEGGEQNHGEVQERLSNLHYEMQCVLKDYRKALDAPALRIDEIDSAAQADEIIYAKSKEASDA